MFFSIEVFKNYVISLYRIAKEKLILLKNYLK